MNPDTIDPGSEVTETVQPPFLRAPVEAIRPVTQQVLQVTEVCALPPRSAGRRPRPPRVQDPRPQVGEHLVAHPDIELLCPEGSHPASLAWRRLARGTPGSAPTQRAARERPETISTNRTKQAQAGAIEFSSPATHRRRKRQRICSSAARHQ